MDEILLIFLDHRSQCLRRVGLSRQKIAGVRAVAAAFDAGELDNRRLRHMDDAQVVEAVTRVRGIGEWTAQYIAMRALGQPDMFLPGDLGVRRALANGNGKPPTAREAQARSEAWRPWRAYAVLHLWMSEDGTSKRKVER